MWVTATHLGQFPMAIPVPSGCYDPGKFEFGVRVSLILVNFPFISEEPVKIPHLEF